MMGGAAAADKNAGPVPLLLQLHSPTLATAAQPRGATWASNTRAHNEKGETQAWPPHWIVTATLTAGLPSGANATTRRRPAALEKRAWQVGCPVGWGVRCAGGQGGSCERETECRNARSGLAWPIHMHTTKLAVCLADMPTHTPPGCSSVCLPARLHRCPAPSHRAQ